MSCLQHQAQNPVDAVFCENCGSRPEVVWPNYGGANRLGAKVCKKYGLRLLEAAPATLGTAGKFRSVEAYTPKNLAKKILNSKSAHEGERKHVTLLFADMFQGLSIHKMRTREKADRALKDIEDFLDDLRTKIMKKLGNDDFPFNTRALHFALASASRGKQAGPGTQE
jgi:hypothetical protein